MKALLFDGALRVDHNHPVPEPSRSEALIRVLNAGVCRTDLEITKGYVEFRGILGHEFVGVVEKSPDQSLIGKRVVGEISVTCGTCIYCLQQLPMHCANRSVLGIQDKNGVFAEYVTLPVENIHLVPEAVSNDRAVFVEPLAASLEILEQVHIRPYDQVIILGDGNLGLLCAQVVTMTGAQVLAVGKHRHKLDILKGLGIRTCLLDELTHEKAGVVIECTGSPSGLPEALKIVHPRGTIVLKSTFAGQTKTQLTPLVINEITLVGSRCGPFGPALRLLESAAIDTASLISHRFPLEQGVEAIQKAGQKKSVKVLIDISQ